jgi:Cytochrome c
MRSIVSGAIGVAGVACALAAAAGTARARSHAEAQLADGFDFEPWLAGSSVAIDPTTGNVLVADGELDRVSVSSAGARRLLRTVPVAGAPEQVVVAPDGTAYVTLRDAGRVARIDRGAAAPSASVAVGVEPFGLALAPDGDTLFVSLAGDGAVLALDVPSFRERYRVRVAPEPRGLAVLADGSRLVVTHLLGGAVSVIDLVARDHSLYAMPPVRARLATNEEPQSRFGLRGPGALMHERSDRFVANLAWTVVPAPDRRRVYVPHAVEDTGATIAPERRAGTYGGGAPQPVTTTVSTIDVDAEIATSGAQADLRTGPGFGPHKRDDCLARISQPRAAAIDARSRRLFVAGFGSDDVTGYALEPQPAEQKLCVKFARGSAPKGLALSGDGAWLYVQLAFRHELVAVEVPSPSRPPDQMPTRIHTRTLALGRDPLPAAAARGRRIFYSAGDTHQSADGHLPCATCHPDGRHDGLVWRIDQGPRQTPVLAGRLVGTAPYNWRGTGATLHQNMVETVKRLGGAGLAPRELDDLELYVTRYLRPVPRPSGAPAPSLVARGAALFASDDVGCAHCHDPGRQFTDGRRHDVGTTSLEEHGGVSALAALTGAQPARVAYKTPSLRSVHASAPYFHDGSARSLRDVFRTNGDDRMGRTSQLTTTDVDALIAYLETL